MSFVPSIRLAEHLEIASIGLWPEELMHGRTSLVSKMPETAIKALHLGATCSFVLAVIRADSFDVLCLGLLVDDDPDHPLMIAMPNASPEDASTLDKILRSGHCALHCVNELNYPMLSADCAFDRAEGVVAADALQSAKRWLLPPESSCDYESVAAVARRCEIALDRFSKFRHGADSIPHVTMAAVIPMTLVAWPSIEIFEVTPTTADGPFVIADEPEGVKLERLVKLLLDVVYPAASYRSPQVQQASSTRELIDVIGFDARSFCAVEAKALSLLEARANRSSRRKEGNVTKDIKKAIGQLIGAMKNVRSDAPIFSAEGDPLTIPDRRRLPAHAIVVVSEMYAFVDWQQVATTVIAASEREACKALFHVMDLRELGAITARCPDSWTFFRRLIQRWFVVKRKGTCYMRARHNPNFDV
jgi:hypothetical protein